MIRIAERKRASERTSYEVRKRWNNANYSKISVDIRKEDAAAFKKKCADEGTTQAAILKAAIYSFLEG